MKKDFMEKKWDKFHKMGQFHTKYPSEHVIRFLFSQFSRDISQRKNIKILDAGCGVGRHTLLLANEGFDTYFTDISTSALSITTKRIKNKKLKATYEKANMEKLPFKDNYFDGIISFGVLYYNDMEGTISAVSEIYRVLRNGGKAFILVTTKDDYRFGKGKQIDSNTYILNIIDTGEVGMILNFLDREEIHDLFSHFKKITIGKSDVTSINSDRKDSHWIIYLEK